MDEQRHLASVKTIESISDIPGKDKIGLATVDGWSVIVQKSEFESGGKCVYCEIDSLLPERPEFEFLRSKNFRIKTMKMAGCISQGICFPMSILPPGDYEINQDVTDILGVKKWERPDATDVREHSGKPATKKFPKFLMRIPLFRKLVKNKKARNAFPSFIEKTDETRIQNAPFYLDMDRHWVVTEKLDGQSGTFAMTRKRTLFGNKYEYIVCSRNVRLFNKDSSSYWSVSDKYGIESILRGLIDYFDTDWVAIQGECLAPGVQGNKYKLTGPDLYVFNVITPEGRLGSVWAKDVAGMYGLKFVPILDEYAKLPSTVEEMLEYAHGESVLGNTIREGVVCRSYDGRQSFKAVDPLFLIKYDE